MKQPSAPPNITEDALKRCRANGDYCPILFEWYKFVGEICISFASIQPDSKGLVVDNFLHYGVLIGLLNRCARLMLSNIMLSHEGLHGETTSIIDRCIFESCIKISWLCEKNSKDRFEQFIADGLKTELKLKDKINKNIGNNKNNKMVIEERMLASIDRYIASSGLTEEQIIAAKKLPTLFNMIDDKEDGLLYIVAQKIGSHHVHGTWPSLLLHYLNSKDDNGFYPPRDCDAETHVNQYVMIPLFVLKAMESFARFVSATENDFKLFLAIISGARDEILKINKEVVGKDFEFISEM